MESQTGIEVTSESPDDTVPRPRVVVGTDDSAGARAALRYAFIAAARRHAALDVVTAYPVHLPWAWDARLDVPDGEAVRTAMSRGAEELRSAVHGEVPAVADVPVRTLVARGTPAQVLVGESGRADLVVVGSRGRGGIRSALLGSTALHCVASARCPVVVVHEPAAGNGSPGAATEPAQELRIVVGVDGSPESKAALAAAMDEAAATGALVDAVAAYSYADFGSNYYDGARPTEDEVRANVTDRLAATVDAAQAALPAATRSELVGVRAAVLEGHPIDALLERSRGAQLLVLGSRGHSVSRGLMLGSVALGCALHGSCPVMVVHAVPAGESAAVPTPSRPPAEEKLPT